MVIENGTMDGCASTKHVIVRTGFTLRGAPDTLYIFTTSSDQL